MLKSGWPDWKPEKGISLAPTHASRALRSTKRVCAWGPAVATTTTLTGDPAPGSVDPGTSVTLTATVTAISTAPYAGSMHFFDGTTDLGAATYDPATGVATIRATIKTCTTHTFTATFTPADPKALTASVSGTLTYSAGAY